MTTRPAYSNVVSFSGGKDSTAMLLMMLERGERIDDVVFFDTGWEFPEMYDHLAQVEEYIGGKITRIGPPPGRDFMYWLLNSEVRWGKGPNKGQVRHIGNGWPSPARRWCTRAKVRALDHYTKGLSQRMDIGPIYHCAGYAADECYRGEVEEQIKKRKAGGYRQWFPLIEWEITESQALAYCRERGFTWGGLYDHFHRVSCFCCPLQSLDNLRTLRRVRPGLWATMLEWEGRMDKSSVLRRFHHEASVHDLEARFAAEDSEPKQGALIEDAA